MTNVEKGDSIVVEGLKMSYGETMALGGIDFRVRPGEIIGFLGPNGAGKTTTMKILTGYLRSDEGAAKVAGFDVSKKVMEVRRRVGYLPENVPLYEDMLVYDYLRFVASMREVAREKREERIREVARLTGIGEMLGRRISELSKGYRQRVGLAQAIIHEPEVLILDEPTTGLDPNQIIEIRDVIKAIGEEKTVIFSTHILQEVSAVCDRIIMLNKGKIVADGGLEELSDKVEGARKGTVVSFALGEKGEGEELEKYLGSIEGVKAVERIGADKFTREYRVEAEDLELFRLELMKREVEQSRGLISLKRGRPTLEEVFRAFTAEDFSDVSEDREETEEQEAREETEEKEEQEERELSHG